MIHGRLSYNGSTFEIIGHANWTPICVAILGVLFGVVGVVLFGFIGLAVAILPAVFLILLYWSFQTRKQRLDDLADEITANLKPKTPR